MIATDFTEIKITSIVKKNVIQQQADDFMNHVVKSCDEYKEFISLCNKALLNYKKNIHCIVFLERIKMVVNANYERHLVHCSLTHQDQCRFSKFYKVVLFYLQNEIDYQEKDLPFTYFKKRERLLIDKNIEEMLDLLSGIKLSDKNNYLKFKMELNEMKGYYFLDKKNWKQLFLGKVMAMVNSDILTYEQSNKLVERIEKAYVFDLGNR